MDENLPERFDIIIVGTGLKESILSGALSRIGKKVLHIDFNDYYGDDWASFHIKAFEDFINQQNNQPTETADVDEQNTSDEDVINLIHSRKTIKGFTEYKIREQNQNSPNIDPSQAESSSTNDQDQASDVNNVSEDDQMRSHDDLSTNPSNLPASSHQTTSLYDKWRQFNIDLNPKLLFARGLMVELLISSNISRYLEFRMVDQILATSCESNDLHKVPCSRADVFNNSDISVIEKRLLMKALTLAANFDESEARFEEFKDKPYREFLQHQRLSKKLQDFIIFSIALIDEDTKTYEGLKSTQKFLKSLGRYGNGAFLWTTYGTGEIPQAFSRLSAVFGGLFCLRRSVKSLVVDKESNRCTSVIDTTGQRIFCDHVILNERLLPVEDEQISRRNCIRAVYVINCSIYESENEHISLGILNPTEFDPLVRLIEVGASSGACPNDYYLLHATIDFGERSTSGINLKEAFSRTEQILFSSSPNQVDENNRTKPEVLWAAYFRISNSFSFDSNSLPSNVSMVTGPDFTLGFDQAINEVELGHF